MSGLKVALWSFGHMNKVILTYLQEKGYKVVAVFGHHDVGKDAGETAGAAHLGVPISHDSDAQSVLADTKPVVAILATRSFLKDLAEPLRILAENQVNVITIGEEAVYSWNTEPALIQELDALFRKNECSYSHRHRLPGCLLDLHGFSTRRCYSEDQSPCVPYSVQC
jgi:2,4-diaminopentanoate dehydrogenase